LREQIAPHVKDITRALEGKVSEEVVERELENYLTVYRVSLETAKRSIVKKYGGNPARLSIGVMKAIKDLVADEPSVNLLCKVISLNSKELEREGGSKEIYYGILADDTGTVPFTAWEVSGLNIGAGDVIRVQNAYTKEFRGQVQVNFGSRTTVTKDESTLLQVSSVERGPATPVKLGEVREGMRDLAVTARILSVERREVEVSGKPKVVFSGILADDTGKVQFSSWHDFGLKEGEAVRIEGGYVSSWRGLPQLSFDERASLERVKETSLPPVEELDRSRRMWIEELIQRGGGIDILVRGIVIEVKEGSGLVYRCPQCRRVVRKGTCRIHGEVQGEPDLRTKAVIDDGSGALTAIFNRELTEALLEKDLQTCISEAKEAMDQEVIRDYLADILIAQPVEARGNVTSDDYGLMMIARSAQVLRVDIQQEARALLEQLGV
jgi:replication factor A1